MRHNIQSKILSDVTTRTQTLLAKKYGFGDY